MKLLSIGAQEQFQRLFLRALFTIDALRVTKSVVAWEVAVVLSPMLRTCVLVRLLSQ